MSPDDLLLIVMLCALTLYAVLAGADFGAGIWEIATVFRRNDRARQHVYKAIGPVWEANHVWVIFVLVILLNGFPAAFAALGRTLWAPLLLALCGIVFRGASYIFRSYGQGPERDKTLWETLFAVASTASPLFLGFAAGAIASGRLTGAQAEDPALLGWTGLLPLYTAVYSVGLCAFLAAVYLTREADLIHDEDLGEVWRWRAIVTGLWLGLLSLGGLILVAVEVPGLTHGFRTRAWPLVVLSVASGTGSLLALARRKSGRAVVLAASAVAAVLWGWGVAQYPAIIPPAITGSSARAPDNVLWLMVAVIGLGAMVLLPALAYLMILFKSEQREPDGMKQSPLTTPTDLLS